MNKRRIQELCISHKVSVVIEEFSYHRLAMKIVGNEGDSEKFIKDFREILMPTVNLHYTHSRFELSADIKYSRLKEEEGLARETAYSSICAMPTKFSKYLLKGLPVDQRGFRENSKSKYVEFVKSIAPPSVYTSFTF